MIGFLVALVVAGTGAVLIGRTTSGPKEASEQPGHPLTVRLSDPGYRLHCSASIASDLVHLGQSIHVTIRVTNPSTASDSFGNWWHPLRVTDVAGNELFDTLKLLRVGGPSRDVPLGPGRSVSFETDRVVIAWPGRLRLIATCPTLPPTHGGAVGPSLPAIPIRVAAPGPAPSLVEAVSRAADAAGGLFANCRPPADGSVAIGTVGAPVWNEVLPIPTARCWAKVERSEGFDAVTLFLVTPADAPAVVVPSDQYGFPFSVLRYRSISALRWNWVVTAIAAMPAEAWPIDLFSSYSFKSPGRVYRYGWTGHRWSGPFVSCTPDGGAGAGQLYLFVPATSACHH